MWSYGIPSSVAESLRSAGSLDDMQATAVSFLAAIGFDYMAFHLARRGPHSGDPIAIVSNYPKAWLHRYIACDYIYHDPVHHRSLTSVQPFEWREMGLDAVSQTAIAMFEEAAVHGIADGFSVPLHSPTTQGSFSVVPHGSFDERTRALAMGAMAVTSLAHIMHERALKLVQGTADAKSPRAKSLTARERECLIWLASGKTGAEIGQILKISHDTANQHINACMTKLGALTRTHAAVRAVMLGIVQPVE